MKVMVLVKASPNSEAGVLPDQTLAQDMMRFNEELLAAGYWLWEVKDMEEALAWVKRCPNPMPGEVSDIEIRPLYQIEDFGAVFTDELRATYDAMQAQVSGAAD